MTQKVVVAPTLRTVRMVEKALADGEAIVKVAELKRRLPRQVNHQALLEVLSYLEESGKIYASVKGITWLAPPSPQLLKTIETSSVLQEDGTFIPYREYVRHRKVSETTGSRFFNKQ